MMMMMMMMGHSSVVPTLRPMRKHAEVVHKALEVHVHVLGIMSDACIYDQIHLGLKYILCRSM